jgi:hypothetical protein
VIAFTLAWVLSVAALFRGESDYGEGLSVFGLCVLPWMVFAGWPGRSALVGRTAPLVPMGLAAAPMIAALFLLRRGGELWDGLIAIALVGLLAWSAGLAEKSSLRRGRYAAAWLLFVLVVPTMHATLVAMGADRPVFLSWAARLSPVDWAWRTEGHPFLPLTGALVLLCIARTGASEEAGA